MCRQDGPQLRLALSLMVTGSRPQRRPRRFELIYMPAQACSLACARALPLSLALS